MINFNYDYSSIKMEDLKVYKDKIREIVKVFNDKKCPGNDYIGWYDYPVNIDEGQLNEIIKDAKKIRDESDVFVVCGIGGSYLGARAVIEAIKGYVNKDVEILYMGNTFDERYTKDVIDYLKSKDFSVNVISKSGSTLETAFAFRILKQLLEEKYGADAKSRIYVTTDAENGCLRKMVSAEGYKSYVVPGDVGGRYSVFTPVGLLPIAVANIDIKQFINGAKEAIKYVDGSEFEKNAAYQ